MNVAEVLSGVLLGAVLLAGCSAGSDQAASSAEPASAAYDESGGGGGTDPRSVKRSAPESAAASGGASSGDQDATSTELRVAPGSALIRTADLEVRVDDVPQAAEAAARIARDAGGRVEAEDRSGTGRDRSAQVQLRIPSDRFDTALADLSGLGAEQNRRLSSEDVGTEVIDLEARLATQRASVDRVRALLDEADALGQVVQIEGELTRRTADLESLEARLQALQGQVSLSTVVLRLHSEDGPVMGQALGFGDGLRSGWDALVTVARVVAVSAGALLPFLPLLLLAGWLVVRRGRRPAVPVREPAAP